MPPSSLSLSSHVTWSGCAIGGVPEHPFQSRVAHQPGGGLLAEAERVVARGGARDRAARRLAGARHAAVDEQRLAPGAELEGEAPRAGLPCKLQRRGCAGIDDHHQGPAHEADIAAAGRRACLAFAVGQDGGEHVALGRAHAVEARKHAVAEPQVAQHRRHACDGCEHAPIEAVVEAAVARRAALAQRQQVEQQLDQHGGVAAQMPAVGRNLPFQLRGEQLLGLREPALVVAHAHIGADERDQAQEARVAVGCVAPGGGEMGRVVGEARHHGAIAPVVEAIEQQPRVRQPRDQAARDDIGPPGGVGVPAAAPDPFADQLLGERAGVLRLRAGRGGAASRSRAARVPIAGSAPRRRTASVPRAWRPSRRARSSPRRPRRRSWRRRPAGRAAPAAAHRPPRTGSASAAAASGACGRAPRGPPAPRSAGRD